MTTYPLKFHKLRCESKKGTNSHRQLVLYLVYPAGLGDLITEKVPDETELLLIARYGFKTLDHQFSKVMTLKEFRRFESQEIFPRYSVQNDTLTRELDDDVEFRQMLGPQVISRMNHDDLRRLIPDFKGTSKGQEPKIWLDGSKRETEQQILAKEIVQHIQEEAEQNARAAEQQVEYYGAF